MKYYLVLFLRLKSLFHSSQKPTRKLAASAFKYCDWMKVLAASLQVSFCDKWKGALAFFQRKLTCGYDQMCFTSSITLT